MEARRSSVRMTVLRNGLLFSPFFALSASALGFVIADGVTEGFEASKGIGIALFGFVTLLLGYQVVQSIRDLFAGKVETVGVVARRWSRNEFLLFRNGYVFVENNVFRLDPKEFVDIKLGDTVRVVHYPHTSTVESVEIVSKESAS